MKFDIVIGNPPFQIETTKLTQNNGQKSRKNIFHYFQMSADEITTLGSVLIYPGGRWIHQSGKGLKKFGKKQINDPTMASLVFYPDAKEVFGNSADLSDGVSIVVKDKTRNQENHEFKFTEVKGNSQKSVMVNYPGEDLLPLDPDDIVILEHLKDFMKEHGLKPLHDGILPRSLFGVESDYVSKNPDKVRLYNSEETLAPDEIKVFTNDKAGKAGRAKWYVMKLSDLPKGHEKVQDWKVAVSSANAGGQKRDWQLEIMDNRTAFGRSRVGLRSFKTEKEALNFYNYVKTPFIRYAFLMTDESLTSLGKNVPDLGNYTDDNGIVTFDDSLNEQLFRLSGIPKDIQSKMESKIFEIDKKRGKAKSATHH